MKNEAAEAVDLEDAEAVVAAAEALVAVVAPLRMSGSLLPSSVD